MTVSDALKLIYDGERRSQAVVVGFQLSESASVTAFLMSSPKKARVGGAAQVRASSERSPGTYRSSHGTKLSRGAFFSTSVAEWRPGSPRSQPHSGLGRDFSLSCRGMDSQSRCTSV